MYLVKLKPVRELQYHWILQSNKIIYKQNLGRNNIGRITCKVRCLGHKKKFYKLTWAFNQIAICIMIRYRARRNAYVALILPINSILKPFWILAPYKFHKGYFIVYSIYKAVKLNSLLRFFNLQFNIVFLRIPISIFITKSQIFGIRLVLGQYARGSLILAAGTYATVIAYNILTNKSLIIIPSGSYIKLNGLLFGTSGIVSNPYYHLIDLYKAGQNKHMGFKSLVRGVAINPVDHPHGGNNLGRQLVRPWGLYTKGYKTVK